MEKRKCACGAMVWLVPLDVGYAGKCHACGWVWLGGSIRPGLVMHLPADMRPK